MKNNIISFAAGVVVAAASLSAFAQAALGPGSFNRYATDAYPGFDNTDEMTKPERKEPKWFSFITGPNRDNAADQFAYCQTLVADQSYSKAARQLDALVRNWPTAPEAPKAQQQLAELLLEKLDDCIEAFAAYRYLLDFYSLSCDYDKVADKLYEVAGIMKLDGKAVMFVRFDNTVDVRRAYETCVLRAPGAKWVPTAMLVIASLREADGKYGEAVKVYENLRNLYPESDEAKRAWMGEANARMVLLREHGYNRTRCRDTLDFLRLALKNCRPDDAAKINEQMAEAKAQIENEAYLGAKFYDSRTRTKRSAINAYEQFLAEYPNSEHADEIRARLTELKAQP